jgi:hypothetical protein
VLRDVRDRLQAECYQRSPWAEQARVLQHERFAYTPVPTERLCVCRGSRGGLRPSGGSRDRTKSPAVVSRKREHSRSRAETFGGLADQKRQMGRRRLVVSARKRAIGGLFWRSKSGHHLRRSGWLRREDSDRRMVESKSADVSSRYHSSTPPAS